MHELYLAICLNKFQKKSKLLTKIYNFILENLVNMIQ